jgi:hypothetical protein
VYVVRKWPFRGKKSFCVLEYHTVSLWLLCNVHFVQSTQRIHPTDKTIRAWYKQFTGTGCLCKQESSGRPLTTEDDVEPVRAMLVCVCGKNLNIVSIGAVSSVVYTSNICSCQNKFFSFPVAVNNSINPLNAELNSVCPLLALLGAHHILYVSRIRVRLG